MPGRREWPDRHPGRAAGREICDARRDGDLRETRNGENSCAISTRHSKWLMSTDATPAMIAPFRAKLGLRLTGHLTRAATEAAIDVFADREARVDPEGRCTGALTVEAGYESANAPQRVPDHG